MSELDGGQTRLRITFAKRGALRYTSHLDLARIWERLLRRAGVGVVYSQGFNPRPKIHLAAALPLGCTSRCEVLDVWLATGSPPPLDDLRLRLQGVAPDGLEVLHLEEVALRGPALQTLTQQATYEITLPADTDSGALREAVAHVMAAGQLLRDRRGRSYDLRPLIVALEVDESADGAPRLRATLGLSESSGVGRPDELLDALGLDAAQAQVERVAILFAEPDESAESPLGGANAQARAS